MAIKDAPNLDCRKCSEDTKMLRGCETEVEPYYLDDLAYTRCPLKLISQEEWTAIRFFNFVDKGILPIEGGVLEQSSKFVDTMGFISQEMIQQQRRQAKNHGQ
jgi:hypothetical protein